MVKLRNVEMENDKNQKHLLIDYVWNYFTNILQTLENRIKPKTKIFSKTEELKNFKKQ